MAQIHELISYRQTVAELTSSASWLERVVSTPIAMVFKLLRVRGPTTCTDDLPVDGLRDLETSWEDMPPRVREQIDPVKQALEQLGFQLSICHTLAAPQLQSELAHVYFRRPVGQEIGRVTYHRWLPADRERVSTSFLSVDPSGTAILTTNARVVCPRPDEIHVDRTATKSIGRLYERYERTCLSRNLTPINLSDDDAVRQAVEDFHESTRQFQLKRGTYASLRPASPQAHSLVERRSTAGIAPRTERFSAPASTERVSATAGFDCQPQDADLDDDTQEHAGAIDPATEEIVELMEQSVQHQSSLTKNSLLLVISMGVFIIVSRGQQDWTWTLLLIPVLLIHELGHLLAMRICGYRNTKIFFIPFFGAAASGTNVSAAGWMRVLVSLAGPIAGLTAGFLGGTAGLLLDQGLLIRFGIISCIVNAFNLLPIMPLDGGWVMHRILFCRHPLLDTGFRVCGALALGLITFLSGGFLFVVLGVWMLLGAFGAYRVGKVALNLRRQGVVLPSEEEGELDRNLAIQSAEGIREAYQHAPNLTPKTLATLSLEVYSLVNARPPGGLASFCWGCIQVVAFLAGVGGLVLLMIGQDIARQQGLPAPAIPQVVIPADGQVDH